MKSVTLATAALVLLIGTGLVSAMSGYRWKYRPLVVFAESATNASLAEQRRIVAASRAGFVERDIVVIWVTGNDVSAEFGPPPRENAAALRRRFGASNDAFRAVLVGKDGGAKLTSSSPLGAGALYATIDAMPMRREEMRRR